MPAGTERHMRDGAAVGAGRVLVGNSFSLGRLFRTLSDQQTFCVDGAVARWRMCDELLLRVLREFSRLLNRGVRASCSLF